MCLQGMYIWVCKDCPMEIIQAVLEVQHFGAIPEIMVSQACMREWLIVIVGIFLLECKEK